MSQFRALAGRVKRRENFSGIEPRYKEAFMPGGFAGLDNDGRFGQSETFGDIFTTEAVGRPFDRWRSEADFQFVSLRTDHLIFTRPRLDEQMNSHAILARLQPGGDQ